MKGDVLKVFNFCTMITLNLIPEPFVLIFYCNTGSLLTPPTQRKKIEWLMRKSPLKTKIRKSTIAKSFKVTKWYRLTWTVSFCRLWDSSPETEDGLLYHFIQLPVHPRFDSTLDCFAFSVFFWEGVGGSGYDIDLIEKYHLLKVYHPMSLLTSFGSSLGSKSHAHHLSVL